MTDWPFRHGMLTYMHDKVYIIYIIIIIVLSFGCKVVQCTHYIYESIELKTCCI